MKMITVGNGAFLPEDVVEFIIVRLPPKGVTKFKCTSTAWRRRLSEPCFAAMYYRFWKGSLRYFFSNHTYDIHRYVSADDLSSKHEHLRIDKAGVPKYAVAPVASAGNLIAYYESAIDGWRDCPRYVGGAFFIADPLTGDRFHLPPPPPASDSPRLFDPTRFLVYGIFYDRNNLNSDPNNFVFCELTDANAQNIINPDRRLLVNKYCSQRCVWDHKIFDFKHMEKEELCEYFVLAGRAVSLRAHLHWLVEEPCFWILAYNPRDDNLSLIPTPHEREYVDCQTGLCSRCGIDQIKEQKYACSCRYLGECGRNLVYIRITGNSEFRMWILDDYDKALWLPQARFVIDNNPHIGFPPCLHKVFWSTLTKQGNDVVVYFMDIERSLFSYNCSIGEVKKSGECMDITYGDSYSTSPLFPYDQVPSNNTFHFPRDIGSGMDTSTTDGDGILGGYRPLAWRFYHIGVYELMARFYPHRDFLPGRTSLQVHHFPCPYEHSDFVRLEASLYGRIFPPRVIQW